MKKLKLSFINPPHADWSTPANLTWMLLESHYKHTGLYPDRVEFLPAPYKFDSYTSFQEIKDAMDLGEPADVYCFSSYVWNYDMCDKVAQLVREQQPEAILVLGGPHIGRNEPELISMRLELYNYICQITKPGEAFFNSLLDGYFGNLDQWPAPSSVTWEWRSDKQEVIKFPEYSVYKEHLNYLKQMHTYAADNRLEPFMAIESTRGCPYKCTFCEWGGGIGGKVYKKSMDIWKEDIASLKEAGYRDVYLSDANFGAFKERDIEIFKWSFDQGITLTDISSFKSKDLKRRKDLIDSWFEVIGKGKEKHSRVDYEINQVDAKDVSVGYKDVSVGYDGLWSSEDGSWLWISAIPTVSIQSASQAAMDVAERVDLSLDDKIALSEYIGEKCANEGYPKPPVEMILGMPGSTLEDFYKEYDIYWNFKSLGSARHDYMFLPDSELTNPEYIEKYNIEIVDCYTDVIDEDGADSRYAMYRSLKTSFKTIASCYSFTREDMHQMWFMNVCGNWLLQTHYSMFEDVLTPGEFCKISYHIAKDSLPGFDEVHAECVDVLNPDTPPRSLKKIGNKPRSDAVIDLFKEVGEMLFLNEMFVKAYSVETS